MADPLIPEGFEIETQGGLPEGFEIEKSTLLTDPMQTVKRSGGEFISGMAQTVMHPVATAKGIGRIAAGAVQKAIPGEQEYEQYADALGKFYSDRYGSIENAKYTAISDPVGFLADASTVLAGIGGVTKAAGIVTKVNQAVRVGKSIGTISKAIDPMSIAINAVGDAASRITTGRRLKLPGNKVDNDLLAIAKQSNVDLPASAVSSSKFVPLAEAFASKGLFSAKMNKKILTAKDRMVELADDIVRDTGKSPDLSTAGNAMFKGAERFRDVYMKLKNKMYDKANISEEASRIVLSPNELKKTSDFIDTMMLKKQAAAGVIGEVSDTGIFRKIKDAIYGDKGQVNAYQVRSAIQELNEKLSDINDPVITGNRGAIRKMVASLSDDLDNAISVRNPELAADIAKANAVYKRGLDLLNSSFGEKIFQLKDQPDKIVGALFNKTTSVEDIPRIYSLIGKKNVPYVQSSVLENILDGAKSADGKFTANGISRMIDKYGEDRLSTILTDDQYTRLKNVDKLARSLGKAEKVSEGSQTAFNARVAAELAGMFVNPVVSLKAILGDAAVSQFVASPLGQKLLSEGVTLMGATGRTIKKATPAGRVLTRASRGQPLTRETGRERQ